jgi:hypothetical protein
MKRILYPIAGALAFAIILALSALAQSDLVARFTPFLIDISQAVPVEVTVTLPDADGEPITTTVPLTVSVNLRVHVEGPQVATVELLAAPEPAVAVATATTIPNVDPNNPLDAFTLVEWQGEQTIKLEGIQITLRRIRLADWQAIIANEDPNAQQMAEDIADMLSRFSRTADDKSLIGVIYLEITNTNDSTYRVSPGEGAVVLGSEQIDLSDYTILNMRTALDGEILPGVVKEGLLVFFTTRTTPEDLADDIKFIFQTKRPTKDNFYQGETDFIFEETLTAK